MASSSSTSTGNQMNLATFSWLCPGLHGPGTRQDIGRRTFGGFLKADDSRVLIPLFQRRYCWNRKLISGWFCDTVGGKRDHLGVHNSGNVVVKRSEAEGGNWICIDGQQRITTATLLVAAIRDCLVRVIPEGPDRLELQRDLERVLYHDQEAAELFFKEVRVGFAMEEGSDMQFVRVLPSYLDRKPFFELLIEGRIGKDLNSSSSEEESSVISLQKDAKRWFDSQVEHLVAKYRSRERKLAELADLAHLALEKMGLTRVEILNEINMAQVFLWLQEKSLFGDGALLHNPSPGIDFSGADLIRNLILVSVMDQSLSYQAEFYRERWLEPIERGSGSRSPGELSEKLLKFAEEQTPDAKSRHYSRVEKSTAAALKMSPKNKVTADSCKAYARFYSLYEERLLEVRHRGEGGVFKKPRRANIVPGDLSTAEEEPMPEFTEAEVKEVCAALLEDITKYLS